jgi:hypothetical protein
LESLGIYFEAARVSGVHESWPVSAYLPCSPTLKMVPCELSHPSFIFMEHGLRLPIDA